MDREQVLVIGAGAIGMLFAHNLTEAGIKITFLTRSEKQANLIRSEGCFLHKLDGSKKVIMPETLSFNRAQATDWVQSIECRAVLVTVKQPQLPPVLEWIQQNIDRQVPILFLMNGLGHVQKIETLLKHPVYFAITQCGATRRSSNEVEEKGRGITKLGNSLQQTKRKVLACQQRMEWFLLALRQRGLDVQWSLHIENEMLKKCVVNACINPLTALFRVQNGKLVDNQDFLRLMRGLYLELEMLYAHDHEAIETVFQHGELWKEIKHVCRITSQNQSSMLQDLLHQRKTEIDSINGYFLTVAKDKHLSLPYHQFVFSAVKALERENEPS